MTFTRARVMAIALLIFAAIMAWDCYLYNDSIPGNSITQVVIALSQQSHLIPWAIGFAFGFLACHFFEGT